MPKITSTRERPQKRYLGQHGRFNANGTKSRLACQSTKNVPTTATNETSKQYLLQSRNPDKEKYADIPVDGELTVQGVAVCVTHQFP